MWELLIVEPFTNVLLWIYKIVGGNFGLAIILFTIVIRLVTHPLQAKQIKSTHVMQEMQQSKEWQNIQKKYKDDKEKLSQEQMKLYKKLGVNPFGSCLPTLIQIPIIFGLYQSIMRALAASPIQLLELTRSLYSTFGAPELVPLNSQFLWMNLAQPERIYIGTLAIPLLAVIVALTTFVQSKLTMPSTPSTGSRDQTAMMSSMMTIYMPLLLGYFAMTYASGLAVYFIASNLVGILQYAALGKVNWQNLLPKGMRSEKSK
ncbi:MAG: YidC/Oxa1 family membrane protein insertase [Chloroflexota bacterium]